jgi:hypothetical protein
MLPKGSYCIASRRHYDYLIHYGMIDGTHRSPGDLNGLQDNTRILIAQPGGRFLQKTFTYKESGWKDWKRVVLIGDTWRQIVPKQSTTPAIVDTTTSIDRVMLSNNTTRLHNKLDTLLTKVDRLDYKLRML